MKRILLILPLLFWLGCEDKSEDDSIPDEASIYGLWEWRYYNNNDSLTTYDPVRWWSLISEENYSERYLQNIDTDSACYGSWFVLGDSIGGFPASWEISAEDSATIILFWDVENDDDDYVAGLKVVEDTLYWYEHTFDVNRLCCISVRIESLDFTPLCD